MQIAVISDVHSNHHALLDVLKDIAKQSVDNIICTGDLVGYGAQPNEVIDTIRKHNIITVMGNYDDGVGNIRPQCGCDYPTEEAARLGTASLAWTVKNTSEENRRWLARLPRLLEVTLAETAVLFSHGSPRALNEYLFEDEDLAQREILLDYTATAFVCGHTHLPFHKTLGTRHFINAGSVGKPKNGNPAATYVILSVAKDKISSEIRQVPYDFESAAAAIEAASGLPDEFAGIPRRGK